MNYEVVELKGKKILGICGITGNNEPTLHDDIVSLLGRYGGDIKGTIKNTIDGKLIILYSDYMEDKYTVTVGEDVSLVENNELELKVIPAGKYAKFSINGDISEVAKVWQKIWEMDLNRSFTGDFEEYTSFEGNLCELDIYIALN